MYIPASVKKIGNGIIFANPNLKELVLDSENKYFKMESNILLTKTGKTVKLAFGRDLLEIPEGVIIVNADFVINPELTKEIRYPSTLKKVYKGYGTFNLEKLVFQAKVSPYNFSYYIDYWGDSDSYYYGNKHWDTVELVLPRGTLKEYKEIIHFNIKYNKITTVKN